MKSPRVFVSSTCSDFADVRAQLSSFLEEYGFDPILSEADDVFDSPDVSAEVMADELVDLIDENDEVIGRATKDECQISLFVGETGAEPAPNIAEIEELFYLTIDEIRAAMEADTLNFGASFKKVFAEYLAARLA